MADFDRHPAINKIELLEETLVLISNKPEITAEDLKQKPMLVFKEGCSYRDNLERWLYEEGIKSNRVKEFGTMETIIGSVKSGLGISLVPRSSVSELIASGILHSHEIPGQYSNISTDFIWLKNMNLSHIMERFIETIKTFRVV